MKNRLVNSPAGPGLQTFQVAGRSIAFTPTIEQIPFGHIRENQSAATLMLDCDGTIARHNDPEIDPIANDTLLQAFSEGVISKLVLISNNSKQLTERRARNLHVDPDALYTPSRLFDIKPSPRMIKRAMDYCGVEQSDVLAIGDGITDAIAYTRAGVDSVIVHPYDTCEARGYPFRSSVRRASNFILKSAGVSRCPEVARL